MTGLLSCQIFGKLGLRFQAHLDKRRLTDLPMEGDPEFSICPARQHPAIRRLMIRTRLRYAGVGNGNLCAHEIPAKR